MFIVDSDFLQGVKKVFGSDEKKEFVDPYFIAGFAGTKVCVYLLPRYIGDGVLFSIDFFVCLFVCFFLSFFLSSLARLRENGWTDLHEIFIEGME